MCRASHQRAAQVVTTSRPRLPRNSCHPIQEIPSTDALRPQATLPMEHRTTRSMKQILLLVHPYLLQVPMWQPVDLRVMPTGTVSSVATATGIPDTVTAGRKHPAELFSLPHDGFAGSETPVLLVNWNYCSFALLRGFWNLLPPPLGASWIQKSLIWIYPHVRLR